MKNKINMLFAFIIGGLLFSGIVYAYDAFANSIGYDNTSSGLKDVNNNDVDNVQDAIDALYSLATNGGSGGSSTSELINNFSITNSELSGVRTTLNINGSITTTDSSNIGGYLIIVNNEVKAATTTLPYEIILDKGQTNIIKIRAVDKDGNIKDSTNSLSVTTPDYIKEPLEYPILTSDGWINVKYVDPDDENLFTYDLDLSIDCTANDALDKKAFDGDESTYATVSSGKIRFNFGSNIYTYYVAFKPKATEGRLYYFNSFSSAILINSGESEAYNGYYHTTLYGKNHTSMSNQQSRIGVDMYEIKIDTTIP